MIVRSLKVLISNIDVKSINAMTSDENVRRLVSLRLMRATPKSDWFPHTMFHLEWSSDGRTKISLRISTKHEQRQK